MCVCVFVVCVRVCGVCLFVRVRGARRRACVRRCVLCLQRRAGRPRPRGRPGGVLAAPARARTAPPPPPPRAGESLDALLPEAFAAAREAARRVLGMRHFDSQLVGRCVRVCVCVCVCEGGLHWAGATLTRSCWAAGGGCPCRGRGRRSRALCCTHPPAPRARRLTNPPKPPKIPPHLNTQVGGMVLAASAARPFWKHQSNRKIKHPHPPQVGGMVLHEGQVAEMSTGEGKTLVAVLAAYLNALPPRGDVARDGGVHVVTGGLAS